MLFLVILLIVSLPGIVFQNIVELLARINLAAELHLPEMSFLIQRHAAVVEQVGIIAKVETTFIEEKTNVFLQLVAV